MIDHSELRELLVVSMDVYIPKRYRWHSSSDLPYVVSWYPGFSVSLFRLLRCGRVRKSWEGYVWGWDSFGADATAGNGNGYQIECMNGIKYN